MMIHERTTPDFERRRQVVFLILAGLFLGAMVMLNVIGITRFLHLGTLPLFGPIVVAVGVLPYPLTFLCTDLISEFYGRRTASTVVWVGLLLNLFVIGIVWLGQALPATAPAMQPPWQTLPLAEPVYLPNGEQLQGQVELFYLLYSCTAGAVLASMVAYLAAQFCDVHLFHWLKRKTRGQKRWLRNNGSTLVSQLVDSVTVVTITFGAEWLAGKKSLAILLTLIGGNYLFKLIAALVDTIPFYGVSKFLAGFLNIDPTATPDVSTRS